eukprot:117382-Chlamydomonas_euryale.AAC.1
MPAVQSYWSFGPEKRAEIGIKENLIRFAIGIEDVEDVWDDLVQVWTDRVRLQRCRVGMGHSRGIE